MTLDPEKLPGLVRAMLQPGFYPHPVEEPVKLEQTHSSYVLLTGHYAYKIKKPVNFGFLDFTTLEARELACREELRLNRRFSPEIYLDVVPIHRLENGNFQLGGRRGEMVEIALCMREFPQSGLFLHLFQHNQLRSKHLIALGKQIARIHQQAPSNERIRAFGTVEAIRAVAEDNYQTTETYIGRGQTRQQWDETRAYSESFFQAHGEWLESRRKRGFVKECHGDLHLNNVFQQDGQVRIFDCIEFNEAFRNIDVIYDVAFMSVDLEFRGRSDLAYTFLNTYFEWTGDYRGAVLLPLYQSMRAYIRAKTHSFLSDDPHLADDDAQEARETAEKYYLLAWRYTRLRAPRVWVCGGLSGSGKSTVANYLATCTNAIHIRSDAVRKHLHDHPLELPGDHTLYTREATTRAYRRLIDLAVSLAASGMPVVLDAKFDRRPWRETLYTECWRRGIVLTLFYCRAPEAVLSERLMRRRGDISDATAELLPNQIRAEEPPDPGGPTTVHFIETAENWKEQIDALIEKA